MRILVALLSLAVAGCPICPDGHVDVERGIDDGRVRGGDVLQLRATYGGEVISGPRDCGGYWYVNQIQGGTAQLGTIDDCGTYRAPARFPDDLAQIEIGVTDWDVAHVSCADCCPSADRVFEPAR